MKATAPYWRLSGYYFYFYAALGAFMPYWPMYLEEKGFSSAQIGQIMALLAATRLLSPNLWGWLADHSGRRTLLIKLTSIMTAILFYQFDGVDGFARQAGLTLLVGMFWHAPLPLFESVTLAYLPSPQRYSRIRLWGSLGFIAAVMFFGWVLDNGLELICLPQAIWILMVLMTLIGLLVNEPPARHAAQSRRSLWSILKHPNVIAAFAVFMLVQVMHSPHYVFFSLYLEQNGYDNDRIGKLWALGVLAEVLLFMFAGVFFRFFSLRRLLMFALALSVVRWLITGWMIRHMYWLIAAQALHAVSFGLSHMVFMMLIQRYFSGSHQSKGQTLYSSVSYGLGGMLGSYAAGELWEGVGPESVYLFSAAASLLALLIVWAGLDRNIPNTRLPQDSPLV